MGWVLHTPELDVGNEAQLPATGRVQRNKVGYPQVPLLGHAKNHGSSNEGEGSPTPEPSEGGVGIGKGGEEDGLSEGKTSPRDR